MEPKFTKGEWSKNKTLFSGLRTTSGNHPDEAEAQANTMVALAAPDMYAALDNLVRYCIAEDFDGPLLNAAQEALSRARGKTK